MKRAKPPTRPASSKRKLVGVEVTGATPKQLASLKKIFKAKAVSTLGIPPSSVVTKQALARKRRRRR